MRNRPLPGVLSATNCDSGTTIYHPLTLCHPLTAALQIADLVLNFLALLLLSYLVARLVRTYKTFMFRCVGPPDHVVKIYGVSKRHDFVL